MKHLLEINELTMNFGGIRALDRLSIHVDNGEIAGLIGPNGSGKTTFFNCVTGIYNPTKGDIYVEVDNEKYKKINGLKPDTITEMGIARTFQNIRLFKNMTVIENIMIGMHCRTECGIVNAVFRTKKFKEEEKFILENSYNLLKKTGLGNYFNEFSKNLPYGAQRRLEIARAISTNPSILLLDEPAAGMNPRETVELVELIKKIRDEEDISVLLIEHDMKLVMNLCERIVVMDYGQKIAEGTPSEIKNNPVVIKAYLGEDIDAQS